MNIAIWGAGGDHPNELSECGAFVIEGNFRSAWQTRTKGRWVGTQIEYSGKRASGLIMSNGVAVGEIIIKNRMLGHLEICFMLPEQHWTCQYPRLFDDHGPRWKDRFVNVEGKSMRAKLCAFPAEEYLLDRRTLSKVTTPMVGDEFATFLDNDVATAGMLMTASLLGYAFHY